jgi:hypothetical protein
VGFIDLTLRQAFDPIQIGLRHSEIYEFLEAEGMGYAIRLPANSILQSKIGYLLKRPVGRPPHELRRYFASFSYQAQSWRKPRRVVAKSSGIPASFIRASGSS